MLCCLPGEWRWGVFLCFRNVRPERTLMERQDQQGPRFISLSSPNCQEPLNTCSGEPLMRPCAHIRAEPADRTSAEADPAPAVL